MTPERPVLLVVDDEPAVLDGLGRLARRAGFALVTCAGGRDAVAQVTKRRAAVAMVDLGMSEVGGLDVLSAIREADAACQIVLMTGAAEHAEHQEAAEHAEHAEHTDHADASVRGASADAAIEAVKLGALDYLCKPLDFSRVERLLTAVRDETDRRRRLLTIEEDVARRLEFCGMIGRSAGMQELFGLIRRLAPHVRAALISGETGAVDAVLELADGGTLFIAEASELPRGWMSTCSPRRAATCALKSRRDDSAGTCSTS